MGKSYSKITISILVGSFLFIILTMAFVYPVMLKENKIYDQLKEDFTNLTPGIIPASENNPLLNQPMLDNPGISTLGSSQLWKFYPVFPASSTKNNNIRYWKTPNNGKCSPAEMCGGIYSSNYDLTIPPPITDPSINTNARVNFYESHEPYEPYSSC